MNRRTLSTHSRPVYPPHGKPSPAGNLNLGRPLGYQSSAITRAILSTWDRCLESSRLHRFNNSENRGSANCAVSCAVSCFSDSFSPVFWGCSSPSSATFSFVFPHPSLCVVWNCPQKWLNDSLTVADTGLNCYFRDKNAIQFFDQLVQA
jgi:hypothetical protein